jgi:hypothetical protein
MFSQECNFCDSDSLYLNHTSTTLELMITFRSAVRVLPLVLATVILPCTSHADVTNGTICDPAKVADLVARKAEGNSLKTTATALFVVGGALTAATVVLIVTGSSQPNGVAFAPLVLPGGGGLLMGGRF